MTLSPVEPSMRVGPGPRVMGPIEASIRERAIAAKRRLMRAGGTLLPSPRLAEIPLPPVPEPVRPKVVTPRQHTMDILEEVAEKHGIKSADILGPSRLVVVSTARHEAAYRIVVEMGMSLPMVGRFLGGRDHTTILNSVRRYVKQNPGAAEAINEMNGYFAVVRNRKRAEAIELYFDQGKKPPEIARSVRASNLAVSKWILDEIERRKEIGELSPLSTLPTDQGLKMVSRE